MGGHHSWRDGSANVIGLGACLLAPSIVFSQGPSATGPAAPPPVTSRPDPSTTRSPSELDSLVVRRLIFTSNRPPRRLADLVMRVPPDNPITEAKAALGRRLFLDPQTSMGIYQDQGRFQVTGLESDRSKFKTPTLREVARTAPYMHDGSLESLSGTVTGP
jgi:hypothetical protein